MKKKEKKHKHKIAIDKNGNRMMNDNGYWVCKCGAVTFPNCGWFEPDESFDEHLSSWD